MTAAHMGTLAGSLRVTPGAPMPHGLISSRQDWAATLSANRPVAAVPGLMAGLFSLCGNAHRVCAQLAIDAAGAVESNPADIGERLRLETAQEHVRRIGLDWPRCLASPSSSEALEALGRCPLLRSAAPALDWRAARDWLQHTLLHMDPAAWLSAWLADAGGALRAWSQRQEGWLPRLLNEAQPADLPEQPLSAAHALMAHSARDPLQALSTALASQPGFALRPSWRGACAHTGPWARLQTPPDQRALTPWALLGSRLAELVRLCLRDGGQWLRWGAEPIGPGVGMGWVEMARGVLVHQVTLSEGGATVQHCRVIAPTEWNFHPRGEVAQRLSALDPSAPDVRQRVNLLMAAFDPCVPFDVVPMNAVEVHHA